MPALQHCLMSSSFPLQGAHVTIQARNDDDIEEESIMKKVEAAGGAEVREVGSGC